MSTATRKNDSPSAKVRARLGHPVIDADGHMIELTPLLIDYVRQVGGAEVARRYEESPALNSLYRQQVLRTSVKDRRDSWATLTPWWGQAAATLDRATAMIPRLLYDRMEELGLDYAILFPTEGVNFLRHDEEMRLVGCRAHNLMAAELYAPYADKVTPAAMIPMHTPDEAIRELEYSVSELGLKTIFCGGYVQRPIPKLLREHGQAGKLMTRMDYFGIDSEYNYDAFWAKCVELKVAPSFHSTESGWGSRRSVSSYVYNHIGGFAAGNEAFAKALFLGGVPRRFPTLRFAFLEGGASWAAGLYADILGHWAKRNGKVIQRLNPNNVDPALFQQLLQEYGDEKIRSSMDQLMPFVTQKYPEPDRLDEFAACEIETAEDIREMYTGQFYFGCEADDPLNAIAFQGKVLPLGAQLRVVLGSDIGHWDVTHMNEVVAEGYALVERGVLTEANFRDLAFGNAVRLLTAVNPDFFKGTFVEAAAERYLSK